MRYLVVLLALAGCATKQGGWEKSGSSDQDWHMDRGACVAQMESVPMAGPYQKAAVFSGCMQGKGWYWVER